VQRSSGFEMLDRAAIAAVRRWVFEPGRRGGNPVAAWVQVPVRFALR
jgi:protein TonB